MRALRHAALRGLGALLAGIVGSACDAGAARHDEAGEQPPETSSAGGVSGAAGTTGGAAGAASGAAGSAADAGTDAPPAVDDPMPPARSTESVIAEPKEECPELVSGTITVMGVPVEVLAGTKGSTPGPLLLTWHATADTGRNAIAQLPESVRLEITASGGIVFAPEDDTGPLGGSEIAPGLGWSTGDFALADELVACAYKHHGIDPRRIYVEGCSAGGLMAGALTLARSSYVAAAAINSGGLVSMDAFELQDPQRVPSVLTMYSISELLLVSFEQTSKFLDDAITLGGGFAVSCVREAPHCGPPVAEQQRAWEFLKAHPFGVSPFPYAGGLPAGFPEECKVWPRPDR